MNTYVVEFLKQEVINVCRESELTANDILNEIDEIIYDESLSDLEALEKIELILEQYKTTTS